MILQRTKKEIVIRMSPDVDLSELQNMLDYLRYKEITSGSKTKQSEANKLVDSVNKSIWKKIKTNRNIK